MMEKVEELERLVREMFESDAWGRRLRCQEIQRILSEVESLAVKLKKRIGNFEEYKVRLIWHCEAMAGLAGNNGHSDEQHAAWAHSALTSIKSVHALNV